MSGRTSAIVEKARDDAIAAAQNLPTLVAGLKAADPALAQSLEGKALLASKSPWGTLAGGIVAWLAAHYGLGWDQATCDLVAGAGVLVAAYLMRKITAAPISGIVTTGTNP